jgi:4-amino-4-deoxy-L-arabinose transferase-like glycosyltransferase
MLFYALVSARPFAYFPSVLIMKENKHAEPMARSNSESISRSKRIILLLFLVILFAFGLFDHSFWSSNDTREGAMIWDMYHTGRWVTPSLNGVAYLEKPPLLHWTGLLFCQLLGTVNEGLLRLPAALYGLGAVLIAWLFGRNLGRERAGLAAAFMCGTSILYLEYSKIVLTDICLTFMVMFSLYLFWRAYTAQSLAVPWYAVFVVISAATFYAKGLLGPGFVWVSVGSFLLWKRRWLLLTVLSFCFAIVFILILAPWVWALWKDGGRDFLKGVFWDNQVGRFFQFSDASLPKDPYFVHKEPIYYYVRELPVRLLPWTLLVIPALFSWFRKNSRILSTATASAQSVAFQQDENTVKQQEQLATFLRFALVSMALVLHVSSAKVGCYALPMFPVIFLMTAVWLENVARTWVSAVARWATGITTGFVVALAAIVPLAYIAIYFMPQSLCNRFFEGVNVVRITGPIAVVGLCVAFLLIPTEACAAILMALKWRKGDRAEVLMSIPVVFATAAIVGATLFIPAMEFQRSYKPFAALVRSEMATGRKVVLASNEERFIGAFTFYLNSRLRIFSTPAQIWDFLCCSDPQKTGVIIASTNDIPSLLKYVDLNDVTILQTSHTGYKSAEFRLVINKPPEEE